VGEAKAVFHMAAQVAVTTSFIDPRDDFEVNVLGTLNVLEAARHCATPPPVIFASTNKVYGDLEDLEMPLVEGAYQPADPALRAHGIDESRPLNFHTPYGCSKGAADQYVLDYARSFHVPTAVLRMSCIYGQRQMGTEDQGSRGEKSSSTATAARCATFWMWATRWTRISRSGATSTG
jgi:CDP-paratose 2-epimerase